MFINLIAPIFLSLLLNLKIKNLSFYYYLIIYALCTITVIFALSRGAIFFFPIAAAIVASFSIASKVTNRKIQVIALFLVLAILGTLKSAPMVVERFEEHQNVQEKPELDLLKSLFEWQMISFLVLA